MSIGISEIEYVLPSTRANLDELAAQGLLDSDAQRLREFGFEWAHLASESPDSLAIEAAERLLDSHHIERESIDALFYAGAIPSSHFVQNSHKHFLQQFSYPACKVQHECGLLNATVTGISQVGCMGLMSAVKCASDFLAARPQSQRALCVSADVFPTHAKREVIYNVISDGACAVLVEKNAGANRVLAQHHITKGYYWDCVTRQNEIIAAYFPTARHVVHETLAEAAIIPDELAWVIPHNVSRRSWQILLGLLGLPLEKLFAENVPKKGHVIAADNFINLKDATDAGKLRRGDKLLLFNFGFGANWACMLMEH